MFSKKSIIFILLVCALIAGCTRVDVFEKNFFFNRHQWQAIEKPAVSFNITDSVALYNLFVVVRHEDAYGYNNLWMNIYTQAPGDTTAKKQQLDLQLATNEKGWLGSGMDDIFEHRIRITREPVALKAGIYKFSFEQVMREDPLLHVLNVGLRVERVKR
jgi:gliding motility-associated lipoprotein GldH